MFVYCRFIRSYETFAGETVALNGLRINLYFLTYAKNRSESTADLALKRLNFLPLTVLL